MSNLRNSNRDGLEQARLMNVRETTKFLGVAPITVWRLLGTKNTAKEIDCYRVGRRVLISKDEHLMPYLKRTQSEVKTNEK